MFNKKSCAKCGKKINSSFDFCPNCGTQLKRKNKTGGGMLGERDLENLQQQNPFASLFSGGLMGNAMGKMFNSAFKMLEKEMSKEFNRTNTLEKNQQQKPFTQTNLRLMINGKEIPLNNIQQKPQQKKPSPIKKPLINLTREKLTQISGLPKQEPKTDMRRLANTIIYEITVPGVKSLDDISITQLENSIEIKALATGKAKKAFFKVIPISLPIINYFLEKGTLTLELEAKD